ncbi:MAG: hypothetical protein GXY44_03450 [Phycisphaerales bacterium]|nr:hypothetical protein [Phycisphaerales bacterium]
MNDNKQNELRLDRGQIEVVDDAMAQVLRLKSGPERLSMADKLFGFVRTLLVNRLRSDHPDWDEQRIREETAHRLSHGAIEDVIVKKMDFYRDGDSEKHLRDIAGVLKISGEQVDREYISEWAARLGLESIWQAIVARLEQGR